MNEPKFEFAFEVRLQFGHPQVIEHMPSGPAAGACIWGRKSDTMARYKRTADGGPVVDFSEYYFRTTPIFDVEQGKHDWLTRYVFIGIGERTEDGNRIRYYALL